MAKLKTKKFKIEFAVEVDERRLEGLGEMDARQAIVDMVEETWDLGQEKQEGDRPDGSPIHDSYGFEAESVD